MFAVNVAILATKCVRIFQELVISVVIQKVQLLIPFFTVLDLVFAKPFLSVLKWQRQPRTHNKCNGNTNQYRNTCRFEIHTPEAGRVKRSVSTLRCKTPQHQPRHESSKTPHNIHINDNSISECNGNGRARTRTSGEGGVSLSDVIAFVLETVMLIDQRPCV